MSGSDYSDDKPEYSSCKTKRKRERKIASYIFNDKEFSSWLEESKENPNKGFCKVCSVDIGGALTHIKRHETSQKHKRNVKAFRKKAGTNKILCLSGKKLYYENEENGERSGNEAVSDPLPPAPISVVISDPEYSPRKYRNHRQRPVSYDSSMYEFSKSQREDEGCEAFGRYIGSQLKKLPVKEMFEAQCEIQQLLIGKRLSFMQQPERPPEQHQTIIAHDPEKNITATTTAHMASLPTVDNILL